MRWTRLDVTLPGMNEGRYAMTQATYERTMWRLRVVIRMFMVVLLVLVARSATSGLNVAVVITGTTIALLLIASVGLWRQGCRLQPYADAHQSGSDDDNGERTRGMAGASPRTETNAS